jgi:hypothetical protein
MQAETKARNHKFSVIRRNEMGHVVPKPTMAVKP